MTFVPEGGQLEQFVIFQAEIQKLFQLTAFRHKGHCPPLYDCS